MDIVDYINKVDRSNREQEAAYFIYTTSRGITTKIYTFVSYHRNGAFPICKKPLPAVNEPHQIMRTAQKAPM